MPLSFALTSEFQIDHCVTIQISSTQPFVCSFIYLFNFHMNDFMVISIQVWCFCLRNELINVLLNVFASFVIMYLFISLSFHLFPTFHRFADYLFEQFRSSILESLRTYYFYGWFIDCLFAQSFFEAQSNKLFSVQTFERHRREISP